MDISLRRKIRQIYKNVLPTILNSYPARISPYIFDFDMPLTPIEENVWTDIRYLGLPFFMQVPAGPYFIDFADPVKKIGIEVDGRKWHQDREKDHKREQDLMAMGWTIYRIPGYRTYSEDSENFLNEIKKIYEYDNSVKSGLVHISKIIGPALSHINTQAIMIIEKPDYKSAAAGE